MYPEGLKRAVPVASIHQGQGSTNTWANYLRAVTAEISARGQAFWLAARLA